MHPHPPASRQAPPCAHDLADDSRPEDRSAAEETFSLANLPRSVLRLFVLILAAAALAFFVSQLAAAESPTPTAPAGLGLGLGLGYRSAGEFAAVEDRCGEFHEEACAHGVVGCRGAGAGTIGQIEFNHRCARRLSSNPHYGSPATGFRCTKDLK